MERLFLERGIKMKILFFIHDMSNGAGTERVLSTLSNQLVKNSHTIDILSCQNGTVSHFDLSPSINLYSLEGEKTNNTILRRFNSILKFRKICKKNKYDFIVCVDVTLALYLPFANVNSSKIIAWEHFNYFAVSGSKLQKIARSLSSRFCDALVVITKDDYKNYINNEKHIKKIKQIYNPIVINKGLNSPLREQIVLAVGRLEPQKDFHALLDVWKGITNEMSDWRLKIVGDGSERGLLESRIRDEKIKNVYLQGYSNDIKDEYQKASILVCSSLFEGFGMVLIEAQENGLPIISFDCPVGPREIIENEVNGLLVESGDKQGLASAIVELAKSPIKRDKFSANALETVKRFDINEIVKQWETLFLELMDSK